ncbi:MAG TPA: response regulator [Polyangiales bacterium]|nr:response regulator [Polyangiales bacterium]
MSAAVGEVSTRGAPVEVRARVLVVEDDHEMALAVRHLLEREHYQVELCANGNEALSSLRTQALPDLILLDLWTPEMDGWEFRLEQKRDPRLAAIPVIAVSADTSPRAAAIDAQAFLAKPLSGPTLLASVDALLRSDAAPPAPTRSSLDRWNALFMTLTDLGAARTHVKMMVSELRGFPAARTIALDVLLDRAESCARRVLSEPAAEPEPVLRPQAKEQALRCASLPELFAHYEAYSLEPPSLRHRVWESSSRATWSEADPLWVLACCLRELSGSASELELELEADGTPTVRAEPALLAQILRNVLRNAMEAMQGAPRPYLRVQLLTHASALELRIADAGCGAPLRELERAFDPFLSTKEGHAGLGLTVARRLATRLEGRLELDREPGGGSVVRLMLPLAKARPAQRELKKAPQPRLLLVHQPVRALTLEAELRECFQVTVMAPEDALTQLMSGHQYELVLCALLLPKMTGVAFFSALTLMQPGMAGRLVIAVPPSFGRDTGKLLEQLHLWHVEEERPGSVLNQELLALLDLWRALRFR